MKKNILPTTEKNLSNKKQKEISLIQIYENYFENYHGRLARIETSYKPLLKFDISFNETQLPHLLGIHKLEKGSATKIITKIKTEKITYSSLKKKDNFHTIKDRIKYFDFIDKVFLTREIDHCICVSKNDSKNTMQLDVVFIEDSVQRVLNLGLRKDNNGIYSPVTFFVSNSKTKSYPTSKRALIRKLEWDGKVMLFEKIKEKDTIISN